MTGEPQSFVELSEGRRLMVLAQRDRACLLLGTGDRCTAYAARPRDCRAFPFDFERSSGAVGLRLLPLIGCDHAHDGTNDLARLAAEDAERWRELEAYQAIIARWNRGAFHRRRLGRRAGSADAFLSFALTESDRLSPALTPL
jgi:Fe-S-cluster containining protein